MENVYEVVSSFYWEEPDLEEIVPRKEVERFLRKRAWQGDSDLVLLDTWYRVQALLAYVLTIFPVELEEMTADEYSRAIQYIEQQTDEPISLEEARDLFDAWHSFYAYLLESGLIDSIDALETAREEMTSGEELVYLETVSLSDKINSMHRELEHADADPAEFNQFLAKVVDGLMLKMSAFFQQTAFTKDFERALYFYTGPFLDVVKDKDPAFWLGFWDYFLFDYRLIRNDRTPIELFDAEMYGMLNIEEQRVFNDMKEARFSVFYVKNKLDDVWAECEDLFTEEIFSLPISELGGHDSFDRHLYYGHIRINGVIMLNHIVSVDASPAMRRRIKSEVMKQAKLFSRSHPAASVGDFFVRHTAAVRHLMDILASMRNVAVMSSAHLTADACAVTDNTISLDTAKRIDVMLPSFSLYDKRQLGKLYADYQSLEARSLELDDCTLIAIAGVFLELNQSQLMKLRSAVETEVDWEEAEARQQVIKKELSITRFDARYLNEEGFIFSLFIL